MCAGEGAGAVNVARLSQVGGGGEEEYKEGKQKKEKVSMARKCLRPNSEKGKLD